MFEEAFEEMSDKSLLGEWNIFAINKRYLEKKSDDPVLSIYGGELGTLKADVHRLEALDAWMTWNGCAMPKSFRGSWEDKKKKYDAFYEVRSSLVDWITNEGLKCKTKTECENSHKLWIEKAKSIFVERLGADEQYLEMLMNFHAGFLKPSFSTLTLERKKKKEKVTFKDIVEEIILYQTNSPTFGSMIGPAIRVLFDDVERSLWMTWAKHETFGLGLPATYSPFIDVILKNWRKPAKTLRPNLYAERREDAALDDPNPYVEEDTYNDDRVRTIDPFYNLDDERRYDSHLGATGRKKYFELLNDDEIEPILKKFAVIQPFTFWQRLRSQVHMFDFPLDYQEIPRCYNPVEWDYTRPNPFGVNHTEEMYHYKRSLVYSVQEDLFFELFDAYDVKRQVESKYNSYIDTAQSIIDLGKERHKENMQKSAFLRTMLLSTSFQLTEKKVKQYQMRNKATAVSGSLEYDGNFFVGPLIKKKLESNYERILKLSQQYVPRAEEKLVGKIEATAQQKPVESIESTPIETIESTPIQTIESTPVEETIESKPVETIDVKPVDSVEEKAVDSKQDSVVSSERVATAEEVTYGTADPVIYGKNPLLPVNIPIIEEIKHEIRKEDDVNYEADFEEVLDVLYKVEREMFLKKKLSPESRTYFNYLVWFTTFRRDHPSEFNKLFPGEYNNYILETRLMNILKQYKEYVDERKSIRENEKLSQTTVEPELTRTQKARKMFAEEKMYTENELKLTFEELLQKRSFLWKFTVLPIVKFVFKRPYLVRFLDNMINLFLVLPPRIFDTVFLPLITLIVKLTHTFIVWNIPRIFTANARLVNFFTRFFRFFRRAFERLFIYFFYVFPLTRATKHLILNIFKPLKYVFSTIGVLSGQASRVLKLAWYSFLYPVGYVIYQLGSLFSIERTIQNLKFSSLSVLIYSFLLGFLLILLDEHRSVRSMGLTSQEIYSTSDSVSQRSLALVYDTFSSFASFASNFYESFNQSIFHLIFGNSLFDRTLARSCATFISSQFFDDQQSLNVKLSSSVIDTSSVSLCQEKQVWNVYDRENKVIGSIHFTIHTDINSMKLPSQSINAVSNAITNGLIRESGSDQSNFAYKNTHSIIYIAVNNLQTKEYQVVFNAFDYNSLKNN